MQENDASKPEQIPRLIKTPDWFQSPQTRYPDLASAVRRQFASVEEAQEYARSLGVHADYGQRLDIAQLSSEMLARLQDRGSPLFHVLFHEYAHLRQGEGTRDQPLTPRQKTLAHAVSIRARRNVDEFLSEVYAGLEEGVQYDEDILRVYRGLGGVKP